MHRRSLDSEYLKIEDKEVIYDSMLKNIPGVVYHCLYDSEYTMLYISSDIEKISGYQFTEFIRNQVRSFSSIIHPDDLSFVNDSIEIAIKNNRTYEMEYRIIDSSGNEVWVFERGSGVYDTSGELRFLDGFIMDISSKKSNEEKIQSMQNILSAIAVATDELVKNPNYVIAISKGLELLGEALGVDRVYLFQNEFTDDGMMVSTSQRYEWNSGSKAPQIDNPELQDIPIEVVGAFMGPLGKGTPFIAIVQEMEECVTKEILASQEIISILVLPVTVDEMFWGFVGFDECKFERLWTEQEYSVLLAFAGTISSAIERSLLEERLNSSIEEAQAASRAKSEFLALMSHEIRTPLNGVIGFTDLLLTTKLSELQKQYMENVNTSAQSLLSLISDILDFSKIEAGKLELLPEKTDLIDLAGQAIDVVKYAVHQKGIELLLDIQPDIPRFLFVDPIRLRQILINLLSNASKFTDDGEIKLAISCSNLTEQAGTAKFIFSVSDTGIGISKESQSKLFKAFSQADTSASRKYGGTGLGLVISSNLLGMMGSKISLQSDEGIGSTFFFELELNYEQGEEMSISDISQLKHVLIVDDNSNNLLILKHMLNYASIVSDTADNGIKALELIRKNDRYDLVLMDYNMPFMDGLTVASHIRNTMKLSSDKQPMILLHSSSEDALIYARCKELGIHHTLVKPIKMKDLFDALMKVCQSDVSLSVSEIGKPKLKPVKTDSSHLILIAEDVQLNLLLAKAFLNQYFPSFQIIEAEDGIKAIEQYNLHNPDLIIMDCQMPNMDGFEATRQIRAAELNSSKHTPIIALTAGVIKGEKERCFSAGMDYYLTKPIDQTSFHKTIGRFLTLDNESAESHTLTEPDSIIHFDISNLKDRINNDERVLEDLILESRKSFPLYISIIEKYLETKDFESFYFQVHELKGAAITMSFDHLAMLAQRLQNQDRRDLDKMLSLIQDIKDEFVLIDNELVN